MRSTSLRFWSALVAVGLMGCAPQSKYRPSPTLSLVTAAGRGDINQIERARSHGVDIDATYYGKTALVAAIEKRRTAAVEYLLVHGAAPNGPAGTRTPPICAAIRASHFEAVDMLLDVGVKLDVIDQVSRYSALGLAVDHPTVLAKLIAKGASVDLRDGNGQTPLSVALGRRKPRSAALLINAGADPRPFYWYDILRATGDASELYSELVALMPTTYRPPTEAEMQAIAGRLYRNVTDRNRQRMWAKEDLINAAVKAGLDPNKPNRDGTSGLETAWRLHLPNAMLALLLHQAKGAEKQLVAINTEMNRDTSNPLALKAAMERDLWINGMLQGASKLQRTRLVVFYVVSRSVHAALLSRFLEVERDFRDIREQNR